MLSKKRLTGILNQKSPSPSRDSNLACLDRVPLLYPTTTALELFILTQALFYYQLSAIILSSLMQIILNEVREVLKPTCTCEAILNYFFNLSLT